MKSIGYRNGVASVQWHCVHDVSRNEPEGRWNAGTGFENVRGLGATENTEEKCRDFAGGVCHSFEWTTGSEDVVQRVQ